MKGQAAVSTQKAVAISRAPAAVLQRECACGQHTQGEGECRNCAEERAILQRHGNGIGGSTSVPPIVHDVLRSPGKPLDAQVRAFMEPRFGHDFSSVRVHTDSKAGESARLVNALAYTVGRNVVFGAGLYAPQSAAGRKLLAHELTHTIQQRDAGPVRGDIRLGARNSDAEREATEMADSLPAAAPGVRRPARLPAMVQRQDDTSIDLEVPTPQKADELRNQGVNLPKVSAQSADPRNQSSYIDREVTAVGYGIYVGGFLVYCKGLKLPILVPDEYIDLTLTRAESIDSAVYPDRESALRAGPFGPPAPGQLAPYAYYRAAGGLVVPTVFSPATTPRIIRSGLAARTQLAEEVQHDLVVMALTMLGGMIGGLVISRLVGAAGEAVPALLRGQSGVGSLTPKGPEVFEEISSELGLTTEADVPTTMTRTQSAKAAVDDAEAAGFTKGGQPGTTDLQTQPHSDASRVREAKGVSGNAQQSAHVGPTSALRDVPGYSRGQAETTLLPPDVHAAFDKHWKDWAIRQRQLGRTEVDVSELRGVMHEAIEQTPKISQRTKGALSFRLDLELFRDLGLTPTDPVSLPYPNIRPKP